MIPRDLTFLVPEASLLLLALPLFLALFFYSKKMKENALRHLASPKMLSHIASFLHHPWLRLLAFLLFWTFAVLALMNPVGNEHFKSENVKASAQDIIFLLDSSASMAATDTPTKISRFDYAKEIADLIIKRLKGNDMMLATFTTGTTLVVPQTHDALFLRIRLKDLEINEGGNAPGTDYLHSLEELKKMIFDPKTTPETLVIFSDGGDTSLEGLTGEEREARIAKILQAINPKSFPHLKVYAVGMGSLAGGTIPERPQAVMKLDRTLLEILSSHYYSANDYNADDLAKSIVEEIEKQNANLEGSKQLLTTRVYDEYFQIPLVISIGFLLLFMLFPVLKRPILGLIAFSCFQPLVATEDFVARQLYEAGEYAEAASNYKNMLTTMPEAYQPLIHYNLGTILLAEKKPLQAIEMLEAIPFAKELSSNVKRRALINIASAYNALQEQSVDPFVKVFYLRKALQALYDADALDCSEQHCVPSSDFDVIKMELTQEMKALQSEVKGIDRFAVLWDEGGNRSFPQSVKLEDLKEALFLDYENLPNATLLEDIQRLYTLDQDKSLILALQTKAVSLFPEFQSSNRSLQKSRELEAQGQDTLSQYYFWNAFRGFQKIMINRMTNLAKKGLINLIEDAKMTVRKELLLLQNPEQLAKQKSEIKAAAEQVVKLSKALPIAIFEWQKQRYKEGICQCTPWNEVFPLLRKGNEFWRTEEAIYGVVASQKLAIQQWQRALELMQTVPEGPGEASKSESETLNELQKMQLLDKVPAKPQKMPQGGKFW